LHERISHLSRAADPMRLTNWLDHVSAEDRGVQV
jgi:hypothetical protein